MNTGIPYPTRPKILKAAFRFYYDFKAPPGAFPLMAPTNPRKSAGVPDLAPARALFRARAALSEKVRAKKPGTGEDSVFARLDHGRDARKGFPEVVFGEGKTPEQIAILAGRILARSGRLLVTRAGPEVWARLHPLFPALRYHAAARAIWYGGTPELRSRRALRQGSVLVLAAGTGDLPVAEEAALTARLLGCRVRTIYDVGVAGLHRLLAQLPAMRRATVIIAVAGMEGALASVAAGLVKAPVIGVPTSIGYGSSLKGMAALLAMLNSCASGLTVVNIDNGFGAGFAAAQMVRLAQGRGRPAKGR
jgi:NCAIR mutase (PurE)-related protein